MNRFTLQGFKPIYRLPIYIYIYIYIYMCVYIYIYIYIYIEGVTDNLDNSRGPCAHNIDFLNNFAVSD